MAVMMAPPPLTLPPPPPTASQKSNISTSLDEIYIAVMGVTGTGKSSFIAACTGQDVRVSGSLESCTTEIDEYSFVWNNTLIHLIDTPGFDDTYKSDQKVLEGIASWMSTAYERDIKLTGVLYLHRITDIRLGGSSMRNLIMFKKLCGDEFYPRVFLVTTMWDQAPSIAESESRERELTSKDDFWGAMTRGGASIQRHYGTKDSAMRILGEMVGRSEVQAPKVLKVQHEMVDQKLRLDQTDAGRLFEAELLKQREKHEREIKEMQEDVKMFLEMNEKRAAEETEKQKQFFEERIAQSFEDQAKLKSTLEEIQQRQAEDLVRMQEQMAQEQAAYEEQIRNLQRAKSNLNHMDPNSRSARNMQSQVIEGEAEAARMAEGLAKKDEAFQKKMKRVFVKGWDKSRNLIRNNPDVARMILRSGVSVLLKLAEWEILTQITGVDCSGIVPLVSQFASSGGASGGDNGGGNQDVSSDGDMGNAAPSDVFTPAPNDAGADAGVPSGLDSQPFPPNPYVEDDSAEPPPTYSAASDIYGQAADSQLAQQSMDSAISQSQQFEADQAQQVSNATAISGIAAGNGVDETTTNVDTLSSQMNQMNMASMQWQPLQQAASMPAI